MKEKKHLVRNMGCECCFQKPSHCKKCHPQREAWAIMKRNPSKIKVLKRCSCEDEFKIRHHPDYSDPYSVEALCRKCHMTDHKTANPYKKFPKLVAMLKKRRSKNEINIPAYLLG